MFDLIGKTVGPYRILEQAGSGGMATVYKAYQSNMERDIALKILPVHLSNDPEFTKRFQREARAIARLEHSHILPVYDYGEAEGITYIAMRYIKAGTLRDRISKGQMSLDEINRIINQVGSALDYAHRMGVIHRDIKPGNVLVDEQGDTYISDFGLARMMDPSQKLTASGVGLGTPAYMSPEQGQGVKVDHRSDIYSLGIILYEMITGHVPFEAETPMAVVLKHITDPLPLPHTLNPNVPEQVERVILKALAKDPADRYQTAGEMIRALNAAVIANNADLQQKHITSKLEPVRENVSIISRLQHSWEQPRGRVLLTGSALAFIVIIVLWLSQLSGTIDIVSPGTKGIASPIAQAISTTEITPTTFPASTVAATTIPPTATSTLPVILANGQWEQLYDGSSFLPVALNTLAVDPNDPNTIFAGTTGAGVYVSRDGGETWEVSNYGLGKGTVGSIVIDPRDTNIIYTGLIDAGGVYKSTDGGKAWEAANNGINLDYEDHWLGLIYLDPSNSQRLYFITGPGMYESSDGGSSWQHRMELDKCPFLLNQLVIDPADGEHLYAATRTNSNCTDGIYQTHDGGRSWLLLTTSDMERTSGNLWRMAVDPRDFKTIYAGSSNSTFKSVDGGKTWDVIRQDRCEWLAVHPDDGAIYCEQFGNIQISEDGGVSWLRVSFGVSRGSGWERFPFAIVPGTQTLYIGSDSVMKSEDRGRTWIFLASFGLPRMRLKIEDNQLFVGGWPGTNIDRPCEAYRSEDEGVSWHVAVADGDGGCMITVDLAGRFIYRAGGWNQGPYRSSDNGINWTQFGSGLPKGLLDLTQVVPQPEKRSKLWLVSDGPGVYVSDDSGATFNLVKGIEDASQAILLAHPAGKQLYVIAHNILYSSDNNGESWRTMGNPGGFYRAGAIDPSNPDVLYLGSGHKGMFKSTSSGRSWTSLINLPATSINDIAIDPNNTQIVYAATNNGVFLSKNGGEDWICLQEGLGPNPIVYSIAIDPNDSSKVYAVTPDGIFRSQEAIKASIPTATFSAGEVTGNTNLEGNILFEDDFTSGFAKNWNLIEDGYNVIQDESGNYVLKADSHTGYANAHLGNAEWQDYALEFRAKIIKAPSEQFASVINVNPRDNLERTGCTHYGIWFQALDNREAFIMREGYEPTTCQNPTLDKVNSLSLQIDRWYRFRIEVIGPKIIVYLDEQRLMEIMDNEPLLTGAIRFTAQPNAIVYYDDIRVVELLP